jgi:hypothetical protein
VVISTTESSGMRGNARFHHHCALQEGSQLFVHVCSGGAAQVALLPAGMDDVV